MKQRFETIPKENPKTKDSPPVDYEEEKQVVPQEDAPTPEELEEAKERMRTMLNENRDILNNFAGGQVKFILGDGFYFNIESKEVSVDYSRFLEKEGYSEAQVLFTILHELSHYRDFCNSPENALRYIEYSMDKGREYGDQLLEKVRKKFGDSGTAPFEREVPIGKKRKLREIDKIGQRAFSIYFNVFEDIHVNDAVSRRSPRFERSDTDIDNDSEEVTRLYREKLFPGTDLTKNPYHLQFLNSLLRDDMVPDETAEVTDEVREALDHTVSYRGKKMTVREAVNIIMKQNRKTEKVMKEQHEDLKSVIEPVFEELLDKDLEAWDPELPPEPESGCEDDQCDSSSESKSGGEQGGEGEGQEDGEGENQEGEGQEDSEGEGQEDGEGEGQEGGEGGEGGEGEGGEGGGGEGSQEGGEGGQEGGQEGGEGGQEGGEGGEGGEESSSSSGAGADGGKGDQEGESSSEPGSKSGGGQQGASSESKSEDEQEGNGISDLVHDLNLPWQDEYDKQDTNNLSQVNPEDIVDALDKHKEEQDKKKEEQAKKDAAKKEQQDKKRKEQIKKDAAKNEQQDKRSEEQKKKDAEKKEQQDKKREEQRKKEAEKEDRFSGKSIKEKEEIAAAQEDRELEQKYNLQDGAIEDLRLIQRKLRKEIDEMSDYWKRLLRVFKTVAKVRELKGRYRTGSDINMDALIEQYPNLLNGEEIRIFKQWDVKDRDFSFPEILNVRILADTSGSMDHEKVKMVKKSIILLLTSLKNFQTIIKWQRNKPGSVKTSVDSQVFRFDSGPAEIKPFSSTLKKDIDEDVLMVKTLNKLVIGGGTNDYLAISRVREDIQKDTMYTQKIRRKKALDITFMITDGGSNDPDSAKHEVDQLRSSGAVIQAFQVGQVGWGEKESFDEVWNSDNITTGFALGTNINRLPSALADSLKSIVSKRIQSINPTIDKL